jgi:spore maturation protein CgeB
VAEHLRALTPERARAIGEAARRRILAEHTYSHRAAQLDTLFNRKPAVRRRVAL